MEYRHTDKVIVLVDMDCFYCQVEEKLNPRLIGKPIAVVQYNAWRGGGIIAVNYPAKDKGVTRHMRGNEAKAKCPDIKLVRVPTLREKADLTKYRDAGKEVAAVLQVYADILERASVDEAYLDITETVNKRIKDGQVITSDLLKNTHVVGCDIKDFIDNFKDEHFLDNNLRLCIGGIIAEEIRAAVFKKTGYKCSAGIAHNKILAKLSCGLHKPNQQTILPQDGVDGLFKTLPLKKIKSLGGKFGSNLVEDLDIKTMGELKKFSEKDLINKYDEKTGSWLYKIARGIDLEPVVERLVSKSIGCCKKFPGRTALIQPEDVHHWINELSIEISERLQKDLEENNRKAKQMVVGFVQKNGKKEVSTSRTHPLSSYEPEKIAADMLKVVNKHCLSADGYYHITYLGVSAGKFEDCKKSYDITSFFKNSNNQIDCFKMNRAVNAIDTNINQMNSNTFICESSLPSYNEETNELAMQKFDFETDTDMNKTILNYNDCNEQDIFDTNDNYLINMSGINCRDITDINSIDYEIKHTEQSNSDSIFSQSTDIIEFDERELVFNEDYKSVEGFYINSLVVCEDSKSSETDSITNEIKTSCEERLDVPEQNTSSYFSNYFNDRESFNRNFDTSRYLNEDGNESSNTDNFEKNSDTTSDDSNFKRPCESPNILDLPKYVEESTSPNMSDTEMEICANINEPCTSSTSDQINPQNYYDYNEHKHTSNVHYTKPFEEAFVDNAKTRCKECNKLIEKTEMTSHLDYHYAIQIVRDEAHLYSSQNNIAVVSSPKLTAPIKQTKRKKCEMISNMLTSYLESNKEVSSDVPTEICPHCNKRIATNEIVSHLDYHVAKKLHSEINLVVKSIDKTKTPVVKGPLKKKQTLKQNKHQSVMSFFKQNM